MLDAGNQFNLKFILHFLLQMVRNIFAHFLPSWLMIFRNDVTKATKWLGEHRKAIGTTSEAASVQHFFIVSCTVYKEKAHKTFCIRKIGFG